MRAFVGRVLEVIGMLTLGVALFVYGFGDKDMSAELTCLVAGSLIFAAGYFLERRAAGGGG